LVVGVFNHENISVIKVLDVLLAHDNLKLSEDHFSQLMMSSRQVVLKLNGVTLRTMLPMRTPVSGDLSKNRPHVSNRLQTTSMF
jgi:hypothetical protein